VPAFCNGNRAGARGGNVPRRESKKPAAVRGLQSLEALLGEGGGKSVPVVTRVTDYHCMICGKPDLPGYYGRWGDRGVCSSACDTLARERHSAPAN
jgi:hypothetical protein